MCSPYKDYRLFPTTLFTGSFYNPVHTSEHLIGFPARKKDRNLNCQTSTSPQLYSQPVGFVHEFRPLDATEMRELLDRHWTPVGVTLPDEPFAPEVIARLITTAELNQGLIGIEPSSCTAHMCPLQLGHKADCNADCCADLLNLRFYS